MKKCIVLIILTTLIISSSVVTAFAAYSLMDREIDIDFVKMKAVELYYRQFDGNWLLEVNPKTSGLSDYFVVDIGMDNLEDLIYHANSYGVTTQKYEYKDGWYCAIVSGGYFVKDGVVVGGSLYYTWGNVDGYAYVAQDDSIAIPDYPDIELPEVDLTSTNSILDGIYNAILMVGFDMWDMVWETNHLLEGVIDSVDNVSYQIVSRTRLIAEYLVDIAQSLSSIDSSIYDSEMAGSVFWQMYDALIGGVYSSEQGILYKTYDKLVEAVTLLESGSSADLTTVEGYIDEVETKINGIANMVNIIQLNTNVTKNNTTDIKTLLQTIVDDGISVTGIEGSTTDLTNVEEYIDGIEPTLNMIRSALITQTGQPISFVWNNTLNTINTRLNTINTTLENGIPVTGIDLEMSDITVTSDLTNVEEYLENIYIRLEGIEDAVLDAENTVIDITTDNDAYNIFYVEKTDGTTESVGVVTKDAAKVAGEFLSIFYRLVFEDAFSNADIMHDFEEVYTVTDSGVSVW